MILKCLDSGEVELIDFLGSDLTVVNAARVSFGKRKKVLDESDKKLIKYLKNNKHYSPFRHIMVQFRIKAPECVLRQMYKHVVGIETTSSYPTKDHAWNEVSGRYTPVTEFYIPESWRAQSEDNKQGSNGKVSTQINCSEIFKQAMHNIIDTYEHLLQLGVAKEQARLILPLNLYTEVYWTASFQAIMNFIELRLDSHAQWEIQQYAKLMLQIMEQTFPEITKVWLNN